MKIIKYILIFWLTAATAHAATPVLFFTDLDSGPKTGWDGSSTQGAAVRVFGLNIGAADGTNSYVTVCGQTIYSNGSGVETWNGDGYARDIKSVTFYLNSDMDDGAGTISVTTSEGTSNTLPFTIRTGDIFFVDDCASCSNSNDGTRSTYISGTTGPWRDPYQALTGMSAGDITYIRNGTYTAGNATNYHVRFDNEAGTSGNPLAWIGYPGESVTIGDYSRNVGFGQYNNPPSNGGGGDYITVANLDFDVNTVGIGSSLSTLPFHHWRIVNNSITGANTASQSGAIYFAYFWDISVLGNYISGCGVNNLDHGMYFNSHGSSSTNLDSERLEIGWNDVRDQQSGSGIKINPRDSGSDSIIDEVYVHDNYIYSTNNEAIQLGARLGDVYIYNNKMIDCPDGGGSYVGTYPAIQITIHDGATAADVRWANNTFVDLQQSGNAFIRHVDGNGTTHTWYNNIFYADASGWTFVADQNWEGTRSGDENRMYNLGSSPGWLTDTDTADPDFDINYDLEATSPAIGAGLTGATITTILTKHANADVARDYHGVARGAAVDQGAMEYTGAPAPPETSSMGTVLLQ